MKSVDRATDSISAQAALLNELMTAVAVPEMQAAGISASVFELLSAINAGQGKETQASIARRMGITPPSLTEAVQAAVKRGLIEQVLSETDARTKHLRLTVRGRTIFRRILARIESAEGHALSVLSAQEYGAALDALRRLNRALAKTIEQTSNQSKAPRI